MKLRIKKRVPVSYPITVIVKGVRERNKKVMISINTERRLLSIFKRHILISIKRFVKPTTDTTMIPNWKQATRMNSIFSKKLNRSLTMSDSSKLIYTTMMPKVTDITRSPGRLILECRSWTIRGLSRKLKVWSYRTTNGSEKY